MTDGLLADVVPFSWVDGPGNRFVAFLQGCGFDCLACHNPHTIPDRTPRARRVGVGELVDEVRPVARFLSGVTVSGGEATRQWEFVRDWFAALGADTELARLTRFVDTNGDCGPSVWDALLPVTDATMIDLKALDPDVHRYLTGQGNHRVLESIDRCAAEGKLYEVRLLLVPGVNDADDVLRRTAHRLTAASPDLRVKVIGFRAHGVRAAARDFAEPTAQQRERYADLLRDAGVREVVTV